MTGPSSFIKSGETKTSPAKSQAALEQMVKRYGCVGFLVEHDWTARTSRVRFTLPKAGDREPVRVELVVDPRPLVKHFNARGYGEASDAMKDRAERVAWRHVLLWADAALSLVAAGLQSAEQAFLAHTVVTDTEGREGTMHDYLATLRQGDARGRLPTLQGIAARRALGRGDG